MILDPIQSEAEELREQIDRDKASLDSKKARLAHIVRQCKHKWFETKYEPIKTPAYRIEGDLPGTMGVDWRGPTDVPATCKDRWTRRCSRCGLVEETTCAKNEVKKVPVF